MTIKLKLILINVLVTIFLFLIILLAVVDVLNQRAMLEKGISLNILSQKLSALIHETQKERGASAGFIASGGKKYVDILPKQRLTTDNKKC